MSLAQPIVLRFSTNVYRLTAIKKAAYKFGDRCHVTIEADGACDVRVSLAAKRVLDDPIFLAGEFQNEVLDQDLREVVAEETAGVRNLLLAQAFSGTSLLDQTGESADYCEDPLGIRKADGAGVPPPGPATGSDAA